MRAAAVTQDVKEGSCATSKAATQLLLNSRDGLV